jgi:hypothetical protein
MNESDISIEDRIGDENFKTLSFFSYKITMHCK